MAIDPTLVDEMTAHRARELTERTRFHRIQLLAYCFKEIEARATMYAERHCFQNIDDIWVVKHLETTLGFKMRECKPSDDSGVPHQLFRNGPVYKIEW